MPLIGQGRCVADIGSAPEHMDELAWSGDGLVVEAEQTAETRMADDLGRAATGTALPQGVIPFTYGNAARTTARATPTTAVPWMSCVLPSLVLRPRDANRKPCRSQVTNASRAQAVQDEVNRRGQRADPDWAMRPNRDHAHGQVTTSTGTLAQQTAKKASTVRRPS